MGQFQHDAVQHGRVQPGVLLPHATGFPCCMQGWQRQVVEVRFLTAFCSFLISVMALKLALKPPGVAFSFLFDFKVVRARRAQVP